MIDGPSPPAACPAMPGPLAPRAPRRRSPISLTPLIDLVFILLVFFMLASTFFDWRAVPLDTPREAAMTETAGGESRTLIIDLGEDGPAIAGQRLAPADLVARVQTHLAAASEGGPGPVIVRPAAGVPLQAAIDLLDRLSALGVTALSLARAR